MLTALHMAEGSEGAAASSASASSSNTMVLGDPIQLYVGADFRIVDSESKLLHFFGPSSIFDCVIWGTMQS
jgi:hypothetical protein